MPSFILGQFPFRFTLCGWVCILVLLCAYPGHSSAEPLTGVLSYDRATLSSFKGESIVNLPNILTAEDFPSEGGRVRYRIEVDLKTLPSEPLGLYVRKLSLSGQVFLNGVNIGACGVGDLKNLRCLHHPQLFIPPINLWQVGLNQVEFEIYANDRQMNGLSSVQLGSAQALNEGPYLRQWLWQVESLRALTWVAVSLGGLALAVALILRSEKLYLWFGFCSLANALANLNIHAGIVLRRLLGR